MSLGLNRQSTSTNRASTHGWLCAPSAARLTPAVHEGASLPEGRAIGSAAAGLVQYKTSHYLPQVIDCSPSENRLKQVKALKRTVYLAGLLHSLPKPGFRPDQAWIVTLTYDTLGTLGKGAHDWLPDQISKAMNRYRRWCLAHGYRCKAVRVAELQKKGTVHYHLAVWLPRGVSMPMWDKPRGKRVAFWPHGMTNTEKLKTNTGYLMKYLSKITPFHSFPRGLRLTGTSGLDEQAKSVCRWHRLPAWIRTEYGVGEVVRVKRGYAVSSTGEILESMYQCSFSNGQLRLLQLRDLPERWQASPGEHFGPYSTWPMVI